MTDTDDHAEDVPGADGPMAELWQKVLREELRHRSDFRRLFEQHERAIGVKIRQLREQRGWSQADLSDRLANYGWQLHQTNISKLEAGRRPMRVAEAAALAAVFGLPIVALWYLPLEGEPLTLADMRDHLRDIHDTIATVEETLKGLVTTIADEQYRRTRVIEAMKGAALAADRGEIEGARPDQDGERRTGRGAVWPALAAGRCDGRPGRGSCHGKVDRRRGPPQARGRSIPDAPGGHSH